MSHGAELSENQEDKLVSLRTLHECLYTYAIVCLLTTLVRVNDYSADASLLLIALSIVLTDALS